ncbi:MAG: ABC transporter ATP-binding protein [Desulfobacteraceae bacterium]|nr:ABC transporter ATP-binding protein [Desulfobacteraceae bacterium]
MNPAVSVTGVSAAYADQTVLKDVFFEVKKGECFILIGPNGSGKTTLMKIMAGLLRPVSGRVQILGRRLKSYGRRDLARRMAFVPQQVPMDFPFRVRDVVLFGRSPHLGTFGLESARDHALADQAMDFTGVARLADRRMDQLSGGERQRVFIARAICQEPELILLDEPTAALDISHQLRVMDLMEKMRNEKSITVIMVSHDVNLAAMYADTLMLLHQGKMIQWGPPDQVLTYETLEAAYGCPLLVDQSPLGPMPRVTPVPGRYIRENLKTLIS